MEKRAGFWSACDGALEREMERPCAVERAYSCIIKFMREYHDVLMFGTSIQSYPNI